MRPKFLRKRYLHTATSGFTLVEVLVSVLILSWVVIALSAFSMNTLNNLKITHEKVVAFSYQKQVADGIQNGTPPSTTTLFSADGITYTVTVSQAPSLTVGSSSIPMYTVGVSWTDPASNKTMSLNDMQVTD